jgi:hypothetical protein
MLLGQIPGANPTRCFEDDGRQGVGQTDRSGQLSGGSDQRILSDVAPIRFRKKTVEESSDDPAPGGPGQEGRDENTARDGHAVGPGKKGVLVS